MSTKFVKEAVYANPLFLTTSIFNNKTKSINYVYTYNAGHMTTYNNATNKANFVKMKNLEKIKEMRQLKPNWDGRGGDVISSATLDNVELFIKNTVCYQPNIFPTTDGMVQIEFYNGNDKYLQFLINDNDVEYYQTDGINLEKDIFEEMKFDCKTMISFVRNFYQKNVPIRSATLWTAN